MKKYLSLIMIIVLAMTLLNACTSDHKQENIDRKDEIMDVETEVEELTEDEASILEDESEGVELKTEAANVEQFYGTWVGLTDRANYIYGNVTITIYEDGTWSGDITDEKIEGKWEKSGDGIRLTSDIIPFNMIYSSTGNCILQEADDAVRIVLTKDN